MSLTLEERQPRTDMEITSVDYGDTEVVVTAEGNMGEYGRVYASYHLSYNAEGTGGTYTAQGRGYIDADTMASGKAGGSQVCLLLQQFTSQARMRVSFTKNNNKSIIILNAFVEVENFLNYIRKA